MKIGILGYGKEGKSAEQYFRKHNAEIQIFDNFTPADLVQQDFSKFDLIMRSPSVPPLNILSTQSKHDQINPHSIGFQSKRGQANSTNINHQNKSNQASHQSSASTPSTQNPQANNWSSVTRYFFQHCPCPIIGITGTKGKGTTSSLITDLLKNLSKNVFLVGNIGNPALDVLDQLTPTDVVVYEMSSFQLWDLEISPHIAVVLGIEPDHLNVHRDFQDYVDAKANIAKHQNRNDFCIYYAPNPDSTKIARQSQGKQIPYPITFEHPHTLAHPDTYETLRTPTPNQLRTLLDQVLSHLTIPGRHNQDNAEAALIAVASYLDLPLATFIQENQAIIIQTLKNFRGLPHRLQYLRTLNGVRYFDDNFSTTPTSLKVALEAFPESKVVLILGGRDKTDNQDLPEITQLLHSSNLVHIICIGESGRELYQILHTEMQNHIQTAISLAEAVKLATNAAKGIANGLPSPSNEKKQTNDTSHQLSPEVIVLMSPAAASFDMFENVYARGAEFQKLIQDLK